MLKIKVTLLMALLLALALVGPAAAQDEQFPLVEVPEGFQIEKVVGGLTYPTALTWDGENRMYVAESGGSFQEEPAPSRILRVEPERATEVVNLSDKGVEDSVVGLTWNDGEFYFTHRAKDRTGAASRVTPDGQVTPLFSGILDSASEHQVNDIKVGPDGRMYVASGPAFNSAVAGVDNGPSIERTPEVHTTPCRDIVLTGQNFESPNILTPDNQSDKALTGAFVPFGTETTPGQVIQGSNKCGGAILSFDPDDPEGTLRPFADGFRNIIGLAWDDSGEMYAAVNGYDVRGSRPVDDEIEATYRVREDAWYGYPDYSAGLESLADPRFDVPNRLQSPVFVDGVRQPPPELIAPVIDRAASGLPAPDPSLVVGEHQFGSSPSMLDVAPDSWGDLAGQIFVAEWGDLSPSTNPLRNNLPGYRVSTIEPATGEAVPFVRNVLPGPASMQDALGQGIERPFDVKFGPDGAMYIVDYGVAKVNFDRIKQGKFPYEFPPETGAIWKVTPTVAAAGAMPDTGGPSLVLIAGMGAAAVLGTAAMLVWRRSRRYS